LARFPQLRANGCAQLAPRLIVWRDNECTFRRLGKAAGDSFKAFAAVLHFMDPLLAGKQFHAVRDLAGGHDLDNLAKSFTLVNRRIICE
jgi:hypothetical protein